MAKKWALFAALGCLLTCAVVQPCQARVVRFVVEQTRSFAGGMSFGNVGPYQRLDDTAYMEVDAHDPLNAVIVNLDKAPRNARGLVEFSAPFFILKPADPSRGNHKLFYGINNRGNTHCHASGWEPDRHRSAHRVLRPHDPSERNLHSSPGRQSQLSVLPGG